MDFNEFRNRLEQEVGKVISDTYPGSIAVSKEMDKLQGQSYSALSVSAKDSRLGMSLNKDSLYAQIRSLQRSNVRQTDSSPKTARLP